METLKIRAIQKSDSSSIFKLVETMARSQGDRVQITVKDIERLGFDQCLAYFTGIVAEIADRQVIGVALYHLKYSTWEGGNMHLNTFIVQEEYRRQGVGTRMLSKLAQTANSNNYSRISFEISKTNEPGLHFFLKFGATNMTQEEEWMNYEFSPDVVKTMIQSDVDPVGVAIRPAELKDCQRIKDMIQELAEFEKMPEGPKLTVQDLQRDGFRKPHPLFYAFVAEMQEADADQKELIGFSFAFLTFHPLLGKRVHLEDLYMSPKYRGKGVGDKLIKRVAKFADDGHHAGFTLEVLGWNVKAVQFYDKIGGNNQTTSSSELLSLRFKKDAIHRAANMDSQTI